MPPNRSSLAIVLLRWFDQYEEHVQLIQHAVSTYPVQRNTRATCSNASPSRMNPGSAMSMIGDINWMIGTYTYDPLYIVAATVDTSRIDRLAKSRQHRNVSTKQKAQR